jgi:hypothetical protein
VCERNKFSRTFSREVDGGSGLADLGRFCMVVVPLLNFLAPSQLPCKRTATTKEKCAYLSQLLRREGTGGESSREVGCCVGYELETFFGSSIVPLWYTFVEPRVLSLCCPLLHECEAEVDRRRAEQRKARGTGRRCEEQRGEGAGGGMRDRGRHEGQREA